MVQKQMLVEAALKISLPVRRFAEIAQKIFGRDALTDLLRGIETARDPQHRHHFLRRERTNAPALKVFGNASRAAPALAS